MKAIGNCSTKRKTNAMNRSMNLDPNGNLTRLTRVARFPRLRALAWSGDHLYASRGYQLLRARVQNPCDNLSWDPVATFRPALRRRLSVMNALTARLFRDGFHALAVLPTSGPVSAGSANAWLVAAVPGAIVTLRPGETEFRQTHSIVHGTRPLHLTAIPSSATGGVIFGENISTTPPATKSTSMPRPTPAPPGASPTLSPRVPSATSTTSSTIPGTIASGCLPEITATNAASCAPPAISAGSRPCSRASSRPVPSRPSPPKTASTFPPTLPSSPTTSTVSTGTKNYCKSPPLAVRPSMAAASPAASSFPPWWNRAK